MYRVSYSRAEPGKLYTGRSIDSLVKVYLGGYSYLCLVILWPNYQVISFSKVNWNVCMGKAINITFQGE